MDNIRNELERLRNDVWHILQMDYNKRADFIPAILGGLDGILEIPKRNCDVGTAEEQGQRLSEYCTVGCSKCKFKNMSCDECVMCWAQMPYEKGKTDEQ